MIEDCKGVEKSINEVVLVPELAALLQSFACLVASAGSTDCYTCSQGRRKRGGQGGKLPPKYDVGGGGGGGGRAPPKLYYSLIKNKR